MSSDSLNSLVNTLREGIASYSRVPGVGAAGFSALSPFLLPSTVGVLLAHKISKVDFSQYGDALSRCTVTLQISHNAPRSLEAKELMHQLNTLIRPSLFASKGCVVIATAGMVAITATTLFLRKYEKNHPPAAPALFSRLNVMLPAINCLPGIVAGVFFPHEIKAACDQLDPHIVLGCGVLSAALTGHFLDG